MRKECDYKSSMAYRSIDLRDYELTLLQSVDAFLCTFAAIAVSRHDLDTPDGESSEEDRIAVHR